MPKYGLISEVDGNTIEKTFDLIFKEFYNDAINLTEIGLYNCETSKGIKEYLDANHKTYCYTGIDNEKDKPIIRPFEAFNLIVGNSNEVYNKLEDNSQHFIFIDGNHSFPAVVSDFFCYAPKVKVGGYMAFHDTGKHLLPFNGYQGSGSLEDNDMYIAVRKALEEIGLLPDGHEAWDLIFDEADENDLAGGICVFKKLF